MLAWPALYNRFPLLYPDSINYLSDGQQVAGALLHGRFGQLGWMRSPLYALGIYWLHRGVTPWPVVMLHAVHSAWVLWLVTRSVLRRQVIVGYLAIVGLLALLTGIAWVASWVLPDILGALLYLSFYLLVFARATLNRCEAFFVGCLAVWSANSHVTHLMLAFLLCALLAVASGFIRTPRRHHPERSEGVASLPPLPRVLHVSALAAFALLLQVTANGVLTGSLSLTGKHPPFLTARLLGDGPARTLLQQRCGELHFMLCQFKDQLPVDSDEFLWGDGIMAHTTPEQHNQIAREEMPLLAATLRAYPWQQLRASLHNFRVQLTDYDIEGFGPNAWAESVLPHIMPAADAPYRGSRQAHNAVASDPFSDIQDWTIPLSALALCITLPLCWRRGETRLLALAAVVVTAVVANAMLTGVLSVADSRYQVRVIWLLPFVAALSALSLSLRDKAPPAER